MPTPGKAIYTHSCGNVFPCRLAWINMEFRYLDKFFVLQSSSVLELQAQLEEKTQEVSCIFVA